MIIRLNPEGIYPPVRQNYTQVTLSRGGTTIHVAGLVALDESGILVDGGMAEQCRQVSANVRGALAAVGAAPSDAVRINIYTRDVLAYRREGHAAVLDLFDGVPPASTLVEVSSLAEPEWLVEVEVTAVLE